MAIARASHGEQCQARWMIKAVLLDFYGTVVHEDDVVIAEITDKIQALSTIDCTPQDVGTF